MKLGSLTVQWKEDGSSFEYAWDGKRYRYDVAAKAATVIGDAPEAAAGGRGGQGAGGGQGGRGRGGQGQPARGRQFESADSPDKNTEGVLQGSQHLAQRRRRQQPDRAQHRRQREGPRQVRHRELGLRRGARAADRDVVVARQPQIAYYRFDEKAVPDYFLQMNQTQVQDTLDVEAYPKPGKPNPIVDLYVYDVAAKKPLRIDVRDGQPFDNTAVGHYVYNVSWSADGTRDPAQPDQPEAEHARVRRVQPRDRQVPRDRPRGVADRLDREPAGDALPQGRQAVHLGVAAHRLEELLPLRPDAAS